MAIRIGDNFEYNGRKFLDARQTFETIAAMNAYTMVPEGFITYCLEDKKRYEFQDNTWVEFVVNSTNNGSGGTLTDEDIAELNAKLLEEVDTRLANYATTENVDNKILDVNSKFDNYATTESVNSTIESSLGDYATKGYVDDALKDVIINEGPSGDCAYFGDEEPEDEEQIWFSDSTTSVSSGITYDNPVISELFACIRTLQDQVKQLQADVEYLKINGGGGSGEWPDIPDVPTIESFLALEDGGLFELEDGGCILLEEVVEVVQEARLALEDGDLFLFEDGSYILLEEQVVAIQDNLILLENGAQMLLESGYNILMETN